MLIPCASCRPRRWGNLNQEVPTSDVLCRFSGTDHRLQPTHRCPNCPTHLAMRLWTIGGFTRVASTASRPAGKGETSERCKTSETVFMKSREPLHSRVPIMRLIWEDCAHDQRTHSPLLPHRPRQSRGLRTRTGELARARSRTAKPPCSKPGERNRDTSELFLLPYTPSTSTRTRPLPVHRHRLFAGRALGGMLALQDRRSARFTTRDWIASADRLRTVGACWACPRTRRPTSDASVAIPTRYRRVPFAVHVEPIR